MERTALSSTQPNPTRPASGKQLKPAQVWWRQNLQQCTLTPTWFPLRLWILPLCHSVGKDSVRDAGQQWAQPNRECVSATGTWEGVGGTKAQWGWQRTERASQHWRSRSLQGNPWLGTQSHTGWQKELFALTGHCICELIRVLWDCGEYWSQGQAVKKPEPAAGRAEGMFGPVHIFASLSHLQSFWWSPAPLPPLSPPPQLLLHTHIAVHETSLLANSPYSHQWRGNPERLFPVQTNSLRVLYTLPCFNALSVTQFHTTER